MTKRSGAANPLLMDDVSFNLREKILAGVEQHQTGVAAEDSADNEEEEIRSEEQLAEEDDC